MRWVMYILWCEGGGEKAWWVIESVLLRSPDKGFLGMSRGSTPRHAQTAGDFGFAVQFNSETTQKKYCFEIAYGIYDIYIAWCIYTYWFILTSPL